MPSPTPPQIPTPHPTLRPATEADIPAIAAIYAEAVVSGTASFELEPPAPDEMARRMAALTGAGYPYLVAEAEGALLGYAYAGPYRTRAAYRSTVEDSIYVARQARGHGVGRRLLAALIAACEAIDCRVMVAVITEADAEASVALHAGLGFRPAGQLAGVGYKHGRWLGTLEMQRVLGPGTGLPPTRA